MDNFIRYLERRAAAGDPEAVRKLEAITQRYRPDIDSIWRLPPPFTTDSWFQVGGDTSFQHGTIIANYDGHGIQLLKLEPVAMYYPNAEDYPDYPVDAREAYIEQDNVDLKIMASLNIQNMYGIAAYYSHADDTLWEQGDNPSGWYANLLPVNMSTVYWWGWDSPTWSGSSGYASIDWRLEKENELHEVERSYVRDYLATQGHLPPNCPYEIADLDLEDDEEDDWDDDDDDDYEE